jgi:hypothetical protein
LIGRAGQLEFRGGSTLKKHKIMGMSPEFTNL